MDVQTGIGRTGSAYSPEEWQAGAAEILQRPPGRFLPSHAQCRIYGCGAWKEQQAASLEKKIEKIQKQQIAVQEVEQIEPHAVPFSSKVMLDRSEYENLAAVAKKFYVQERKESKLQKALDAAMKMISELKAKVAALTEELAEYKSVRGQLRTVDLEKENNELRRKLRGYEDVISRNNLWSYFSRDISKNKKFREITHETKKQSR